MGRRIPHFAKVIKRHEFTDKAGHPAVAFHLFTRVLVRRIPHLTAVIGGVLYVSTY